MGDIQSMTGFGKGESQNENFSVTVEIKTVNNRYRDFRFRMSNLFNAQEMSFRKTLEKHFRRGSFDISINYRYLGESRRFDNIDEGKVNAFIVITSYSIHYTKLYDFEVAEEYTQKRIALAEEQNLAMAKWGIKAIEEDLGKGADLRLMTHCNTGFLACGTIGTALGVISLAAEQSRVKSVWVDEIV